jgi:hypothetical protein
LDADEFIQLDFDLSVESFKFFVPDKRNLVLFISVHKLSLGLSAHSFSRLVRTTTERSFRDVTGLPSTDTIFSADSDLKNDKGVFRAIANLFPLGGRTQAGVGNMPFHQLSGRLEMVGYRERSR